MFASHTNPISGWQPEFEHQPDQAIKTDYRDYIQKLPPHKYSFVGSIGWLKDGTGQHAITIQEGRNGTYWNHVLIYDKDSKRIKVIIFVSGGYRS